MGTFPVTSITGFLIGLFVGATGVGAGALMMPFLIFYLRLDPLTAVGTDLTCSMLTKCVGTWEHHRLGTVDWRRVRALAIGSLPAATIACLALKRIDDHSHVLAQTLVLRLLGGLLVIVALLLFWNTLLRRQSSTRRLARAAWLDGPRQQLWLALGGAVVGTAVALTSIGAGSIVFAFLSAGSRKPIQQLVGVDLAHAVLLTTLTSVGYVGLGHADWHVVGALLLGSIPGVWLGCRINLRSPECWLRRAIAVLLFAAGWRLV